MSIAEWSTTPSENDRPVPNGWPVDILPSEVTPVGRQMQADIRSWYQDPNWIDYGDTPVFVDANTFTVTDDRTGIYLAGRRLKLYGPTMGTLYGSVVASSYSSPNTTVDVEIDDGAALLADLEQVWYGSESPVNPSLPLFIFSSQNVLVSSDFTTAAWQQGVSFTSSTTFVNTDGNYLVDNWILQSNGNNIVNVTRDTDRSCKATVVTINKQFGWAQIIENEKTLPLVYGGKASVIIEAKASGITTLRCTLLAWTGTTDAPTKKTVTTWAGGGTDPTFAANYTKIADGTNLTLTSEYRTYRLNDFDLSVVGTNNLVLVFWTDDTSIALSSTLNIRRTKLEPSPSATDFEYITPSAALIDAQRYYVKTFLTNVAPARGVGDFNGTLWFSAITSVVTPTNRYGQNWLYPVELLKLPTIATYNPFLGHVDAFWSNNDGSESLGVTLFNISKKSVLIVTSSAVTNNNYFIHATADARIGA